MMDGRFAYREQPKMEKVEDNGEAKMKPTGETYFGWKGLNFKETDKYGNFMPKTMFWEHERELYKYPIKELAEPYDAKRMIASMQKDYGSSAISEAAGWAIRIAIVEVKKGFYIYQIIIIRKEERISGSPKITVVKTGQNSANDPAGRR